VPDDDDEVIPLLDLGLPLRSEPRGFSPDQMVTCEACLRANPPTRTSCLYCAAALSATEASAALRRPTLRRLEKWEQGFNVILMSRAAHEMTEEALVEAAELLRLETEELKRIVDAGEPLPLARAATLDEASLIERKLGELKVGVLVIADRDLALETSPPERIRALELAQDALIAYPAGASRELRAAWTDIRLLVAGRHFVRRLEVEERRGRGGENELADARELSSDENLLDLYTEKAGGSWRIASDSFDFSCLNERKGLLAAENFSVLTEMLRARSPVAAYDESYNRVRHALGAVWPLDQHTESRGLRRHRPGRYNTESVTTSDNVTQFTRYSRLRAHLKIKHPGESS
jgi:hypothetical protein